MKKYKTYGNTVWTSLNKPAQELQAEMVKYDEPFDEPCFSAGDRQNSFSFVPIILAVSAIIPD